MTGRFLSRILCCGPSSATVVPTHVSISQFRSGQFAQCLNTNSSLTESSFSRALTLVSQEINRLSWRFIDPNERDEKLSELMGQMKSESGRIPVDMQQTVLDIAIKLLEKESRVEYEDYANNPPYCA